MPEDHLSEEWYLVRHSGEIPEIALHASLHYLTEDPAGPRLHVTEEQRQRLVLAAQERFREIVLRDLQHGNRFRPDYRGVRRSIANYHRYRKFCSRQRCEDVPFRLEVALALLLFLAAEQVAVVKGRSRPVLNCTFVELQEFALELGLVYDKLPDSLAPLCGACA